MAKDCLEQLKEEIILEKDLLAAMRRQVAICRAIRNHTDMGIQQSPAEINEILVLAELKI